ncbi:MAG: TrmH family RNA methyltransferase [Vicinamibacterales bacterium]
MTEIISADDPRIADYHLVAAPGELMARGLFVVEGRLVLPRLLEAPGLRARSVLVTPAAAASLGALLAAAPAPVYIASREVMSRVAGFDIHRGCLALAERPAPAPLDALPLQRLRRVLVLEGVSNPDNIGGIFRSAAAFDVDGVVLGPGCGDPLYRKAIRTSMGATLGVPFVDAGAWPGALGRLRAAGLALVALTPAGADPLPALQPGGRVALVVGAEGPGLTPAALAEADHRVRIPTSGRVDSLNVATAAAIALYALSAREGRPG